MKLILNPLRWFDLSSVFGAIYSPREFHKIIRYECDLAKRYNKRFSLVIFEVGSPSENSLLIRRLVRTLHHRFRNTDDLGWFSTRQIAVIVPFTTSEGAWKLAEYVVKVISSVASPPPFTIYTYPSERWPLSISNHNLISNLNPAHWFGHLRANPLVHSKEEFLLILERERNRADRNGQIFSLVLFNKEALETEQASLRRLMITLYRRLRDTDEIGWYNNRFLGVLMPYASHDNSVKVTKKNLGALSLQNDIIYTVYTYPENWFMESREGAEGDTHSEGQAEGHTGDTVKVPSALAGGTSDPMATGPREADKSQGAYDAVNVCLSRPFPLWKRLIDIVGSLMGIIIFSPVMLLIAAAIKLDTKGPVMFKQKRAGFWGKPFTFYKFRSMVENAETMKRDLLEYNLRSGPVFKMVNDPRVTSVGRFLRRWSLDELPQFFNVFKGDISLVGPRPLPLDEDGKFAHWHAVRREVKPGITCLWQISARHKSSFDDWVRLDREYARKQSFWLDLKILLMTFPAVISKKGAH